MGAWLYRLCAVSVVGVSCENHVPSRRIPSHFIAVHPLQSHSIVTHPIPHPILSNPIQSHPSTPNPHNRCTNGSPPPSTRNTSLILFVKTGKIGAPVLLATSAKPERPNHRTTLSSAVVVIASRTPPGATTSSPPKAACVWGWRRRWGKIESETYT